MKFFKKSKTENLDVDGLAAAVVEVQDKGRGVRTQLNDLEYKLSDLRQWDLAGSKVSKELKTAQQQVGECEQKLEACQEAEQDLRHQMLAKLENDRKMRLEEIPKEIIKIQRKQEKLRKDFVSALANFAAIQFLVNGLRPETLTQVQMLSWEEKQFFAAEVSRLQKRKGLDGQPLVVQSRSLRDEASRLEAVTYDEGTIEKIINQTREALTKEAREFVVAQG